MRDYLLLPAEPANSRFVQMLSTHYGVPANAIVAERNGCRRRFQELVENRVYYQGLPVEAVFPRLQIIQIGTDPQTTLSGPISLTKAVLMLEVQTEGAQDEADEIAEIIRVLLHGYTGIMGTEAIEVDNIACLDDQDDKHPPKANEDIVFRDFSDYEIWFHAFPPGVTAGYAEGFGGGGTTNASETENEATLVFEVSSFGEDDVISSESLLALEVTSE